MPSRSSSRHFSNSATPFSWKWSRYRMDESPNYARGAVRYHRRNLVLCISFMKRLVLTRELAGRRSSVAQQNLEILGHGLTRNLCIRVDVHAVLLDLHLRAPSPRGTTPGLKMWLTHCHALKGDHDGVVRTLRTAIAHHDPQLWHISGNALVARRTLTAISSRRLTRARKFRRCCARSSSTLRPPQI
jgi:hypothetical protein